MPIEPKKLSRFGLTNYESKLYLSLLNHSNLTAVEASKIAGVPRGKVYEVLESLENKGLCRSFAGKNKIYSAVSPDHLKEKLESSLDVIRSEIEEKNKELDKAKNEGYRILDALQPIYVDGRNKRDPLNYIEIIKNPELIKKKYLELVKSAKTELLIFVKPPFDSTQSELQEQADTVLLDTVRNKVKVRSIYERFNDAENNKWLHEFIKDGLEAGEEARIIDKLPMKMAVFDGEIVLLSLQDPVSRELSLTTQVIEHQALADGLIILFNVLWDRAEDYNELKKYF